MRRVPAISTPVSRFGSTRVLALLVVATLAACDDPDETPTIEPSIALAADPTPGTSDSATGVVSAPTFVVPENVSYEMAETAFIDKRYDEAIAMFDVYTTNKPQNPWGHYMLGLSAWKGGEHERAVSAFESALALDPTHVKSMLNLGRVLLDLERPEEALVRILAARAADSGSADVFRLLGRVYAELDRTDEALESYRSAIVIDGHDAWSMNNMGFLLIQKDRFEEALGPLARAVELRGDVAVFRNNLGVALERTGHITLAAESFRKAVELDSTYVKASTSLTRVEGLSEREGTTPPDLTEVARKFMEEIESWRQD